MSRLRSPHAKRPPPTHPHLCTTPSSSPAFNHPGSVEDCQIRRHSGADSFLPFSPRGCGEISCSVVTGGGFLRSSLRLPDGRRLLALTGFRVDLHLRDISAANDIRVPTNCSWVAIVVASMGTRLLCSCPGEGSLLPLRPGLYSPVSWARSKNALLPSASRHMSTASRPPGTLRYDSSPRTWPPRLLAH